MYFPDLYTFIQRVKSTSCNVVAWEPHVLVRVPMHAADDGVSAGLSADSWALDNSILIHVIPKATHT